LLTAPIIMNAAIRPRRSIVPRLLLAIFLLGVFVPFKR
jgi:hypothetical protein